MYGLPPSVRRSGCGDVSSAGPLYGDVQVIGLDMPALTGLLGVSDTGPEQGPASVEAVRAG
ncbi:hypothetical protein GCM10027448_12410 [Nocardioides dilutus]